MKSHPFCRLPVIVPLTIALFTSLLISRAQAGPVTLLSYDFSPTNTIKEIYDTSGLDPAITGRWSASTISFTQLDGSDALEFVPSNVSGIAIDDAARLETDWTKEGGFRVGFDLKITDYVNRPGPLAIAGDWNPTGNLRSWIAVLAQNFNEPVLRLDVSSDGNSGGSVRSVFTPLGLLQTNVTYDLIGEYVPGFRLAWYLNSNLVSQNTSSIPTSLFANGIPMVLGAAPGISAIRGVVIDDFFITTIPEPSTTMLLMLGGGLICVVRRWLRGS